MDCACLTRLWRDQGEATEAAPAGPSALQATITKSESRLLVAEDKLAQVTPVI
jgi:hypothetical protein